MFKLPNIIWQGANEYSGTQIEKMVTMIGDSSFKSHEEKGVLFSNVAEYLETWLKINRKPFWFMKSRIGRQTKKVMKQEQLFLFFIISFFNFSSEICAKIKKTRNCNERGVRHN